MEGSGSVFLSLSGALKGAHLRAQGAGADTIMVSVSLCLGR